MLRLLKSKPQKKKNNFIAGLPVPAFNPIDANTVALWDGDINLNTSDWKDQVASYVIDFFNTPTINAAGLNGHGTVTFDGVNQYGSELTFNNTQPRTYYLVLNQITYNAIFAPLFGSFTLRPEIMQFAASPQLSAWSGTNFINLTPNLNLNTWGIITLLADSVNSGLRNSLNAIVTADLSTTATNGILLASNTTTLFINSSFAYIIIRDIADDTTTQNKYINYLKNRFAL